MELVARTHRCAAHNPARGRIAHADGWDVSLTAAGLIFANIHDGSSGVSSTADGDAVNDGSLHHIVVVFDRSGNMTRYIDGTPTGTADSITAVSGDQDNSLSLTIGARPNATSFADGTIDEVMVFRKGLTILEINDLGNRQRAGILK